MKNTIRSTLLLLALGLAGQAWAAPATAPASTASAGPALQVKGASLQAGLPLLLALNGGTASEPSFEVLTYAVESHPVWEVESLSTAGDALISRLKLKSAGGAKLSMDVSTALKTSLGLKAGDKVTAERSRAGRGAVVVFYRDKTPLGLVPNDAVTLPK